MCSTPKSRACCEISIAVDLSRPDVIERLAKRDDAALDDMLFGFVLTDSGVMERQGDHPIGPTDAFVIPAGEDWAIRDTREDLALL
jgi:hypothetical protein